MLGIGEPILLVGSHNTWGKDIDTVRKDSTFVPVHPSSSFTHEHALDVGISTKHHLSFQVIGAESLWDLRVHPAGNDKASKELKRGEKVRACLTAGKHETVLHGLNFRIRESPPATIQIRVGFHGTTGVSLWYELKGNIGSAFIPRLEEVAPWQSHDEIGSLRLVGRFCKRRLDVDGVVMELQKPKASDSGKWRRHQLCLRMQHREIEFQVVSERLGFEWRLCPSRGGQKSVIPCGESNDMAVVVGRKQDGYGRKRFRIKENYLTVVLLNVWMEVLEDSAVGRVSITYTVEDDGRPQVAIGLRDMQYPPGELTQMDRAILKIAQNPHLLEVIKERLRAVVNVIEREHELSTFRLHPSCETRPTQRVAAMLMLLPRALAGWPGVFHTFLYYHLLAPAGPQFDHIFVFIDEAEEVGPDAVVIEEEEEADDDEDAGSLARWLATSEDAEELRPLVTLVDGSGPACLQASLGRRDADLDAKVRAAALAGELVARQMLNMQRCLEMANEQGFDWLLCNLDADEAFVCEGSVGDLFAAAPKIAWQLQVVNHEAVLESREPAADFFQECTLFKRNPLLLMESKGRTEEQKRCMEFWGNRTAAAAAETQKAMAKDAETVMPLRSSDGYFAAYFIGKSAIRVKEVCAEGLVPAGPHDWPVLEIGTQRVDPEQACILHYVNCQGMSGLVQKYSTRARERWNKIEFHNLCQQAYAHSKLLLQHLIREALILRRDDDAEVEAQLAAGVCLRITQVRDACRGNAT